MAEIACTVASNLVTKPLERLFAAIGCQFGYVLCYKSYVKDLKKGVEKLKAARERVQHSIQEAKDNGKLIENDIDNWLESVKKETEKADDLLKRGESAQNACFRGWFPNPVMRHPIGRKVKKITEVIEELFKESQSPKFQKVYYENPAPGTVAANTSTARSIDNKEDVLESRAKIMEDVLKAIVDDKVYVIGVWGEGGVGKSKLLEDVERRVREENLFDVVATAVISHTPDLKEIQRQIASALNLKLTNDESPCERANRLCKRLEDDSKKNILIILDDLWEKLELKEVGIPCSDRNKVRGCKLLLTSRKLDVLCIDMDSDQEFKLNVLEYGETRKLFERTVGDKVNNSKFKPWVDGVVKNCGGMPLSIVALATMLKRKDLDAWMNASTNRDLSKVTSVVELSYKDIKEERIRSLFLVCALASGRISTWDSLIYCMGLGLYKKFSETIQNARYRLIVDLHSLRDSSLLLDNDDREVFRMHDIFVDVAISIASMEWNALVGRKGCGFKVMSKDELRKCTVISFPYVGIDELPAKLDCPNLKMLLIFEHQSLEIPESFFESMEKLQVLAFSGLKITTLPPSTEFLENLQSLSLNHCSLEDVTILGKLKRLQFLSFTGSTIARLPKEIGELTELKFLDLNRCFRLQIIERGMLESLVKLEELYINEFCQWEAEDEASRSNASLAELKNMKNLSALDIIIPHSTNLSSNLPFGNLNEHKIQIGSTEQWWGECKQSRTLELELDSGNLLHEVWMQECLGRTQDLRLNGSQDGRDSIHDLCTKGFRELKHLHVKNNLSFHCVVDSTKFPAFTRLESLVLNNLKNLEKICRDCLAPESFIQLKTLKVEYCSEIKYLFPSSMMKRFLQLEEIEITECDLMQHIVADAEVDDYIDEIDNDAIVKSCKLNRLTLQDLPEMTSFCKTEDHSVVFLDGQQVSLPLLESLTLSGLPKLKEIWNSQFSSNVSNLKFLEVEDCPFLLSIFPSNLVTKLQNLEAITIERCQLIREVFDLEGLTTSGDVKTLSRLTTLTLSNLPRLGHIWNKNPRITLCFRNLRVLKVQGCENLRFIFSSSMAKALQQIKEIKIARCKLLEEIMDVQEEESKKAASMHTLVFPLLSSLFLEELPNLRTFSHGTHCIQCPTLTRLRISRCPRMMTFSSFKGKQQRITTNTGLQQAPGGVNSNLSLPTLFDQNILFPSLEELTVVSCGLMKIWHKELSKESFRKLASITIRDCENLSHIFPSNIVELFQSLKMIEVVNCTSLESLMEHVAVNTKKMPKSLVFLNLNKVKLWDLPRLDALVTSSSQATLSLPNLTTISLRNCHSLRYLFTHDKSGTLDKLEMLDVSSCNKMQEVVDMEESEERKSKAVKFSCLHTLKLCSLKSLISFSLGSCAFEFPSLKNLSILECTELKAFVLRQPAPRVEMMNEGSVSSDESPHSLFDEKVIFPSLEELKLSSICQLKKIWHNQLHGQSFCKLASLTVELCENLSHVFPSNSMDRLHSLSKIEVVGCPSLEALFEPVSLSSEERQKPLELSALKYMRLLNLPRLTDILNRECEVALTFPSLMKVKVRHCHNLPYLFSSTTAKTLHELVVLNVSCCNNLRAIIVMEEGKRKTAETFEFRHLTKLKLVDLKSSICFSSENCAGDGLYPLFDEKVIFPSLEELKLSSICQLKKIWHNQLHGQSFCKLASLTVELCENLSHVFPSNSMDRLHSLSKIEVVGCPSLEALFEPVSLSSEERQKPLELSALKYMRLLNLPRLTDILNRECEVALTFPSLMKVKVRHCHNLPYLFSSTTAKTLHELVVLNVSCCNNLRAIIVMEEGKRKTAETFEFRHLTKLKLVDLKSSICFSSENCAGDGLYPLFDEKVIFPSLEELKLSSICQLKKIWHNQLHGQSFCKLASLTVELCENLSHVFPSNSMDRLHSLSKIEVVGCPSLEALFEPVSLSSEERQKPLELSALKYMRLLNLPRLTDILNRECEVALTFPSLMKVKVRHCHNLPYLFSSTTAKTLHELVVLNVSCCNNLRAIIVMEEGKRKTAETFEFRHLTKLKLVDLKSSICFSSENCASDGLYPLFDEKFAFPKLEELHIEGVQREELWNNKILVESFCCLKVLKVKQCHNLVNLIPSFMSERLLHYMESLTVEECPRLRNLFIMSMTKSLGQLQYLGLGGCGEMEYIVAKEEEKLEEATDKIVIPQLVTLYLHNMPKLRSLCQGKHISEWPSLKEFTIENCKAVKVILGNVSCRKLEGSSPTDQPLLLVEKVEFPSMESMKISHMDNMEKIWLDELASNAFTKLKKLIVEYCEKLSSIFSSDSILMRFRNLEKLKVTNCDLLEVVFQIQELNLGGTHSTSTFQVRKLKLIQLPKMKHVWSRHPCGTLTFEHLQCLEARNCESLKSLFPVSVAKSMTQLERLLVRDCGLEEIIREEDGVGTSASDLFFPQLTDLTLDKLPELRSFYRNSRTLTWPLLKELMVIHCSKMRTFSFACEFQSCQGTTTIENQPALFSFEKVIPHLETMGLTRDDVAMLPQHYIFGNLKGLVFGCYHDGNVAFPSDFLLQGFPNLKVLFVHCSSFEEIFPEDALGHGGATPCGGLTDVEKTLKSLENLKGLGLMNLCNLRGVWKDGSLMAEILKQIESMWLWQCPSLLIIFPSPASFQRLTQLEVKECAGLVHMGTCSAMTSLVHLTWLTLRDCGAMEDVIIDDGDGAKEMPFPELEELILDRLPSLESFSPTNCAFSFPSLKRIVITQCPKMNIFCKGALRTPNLDKVLLSEKDDEGRWEGDLNTTIRTLSAWNDP